MTDPATSAPERPGIAEARTWVGHKLDEMGGATVGKIEGVYVDEETGVPEWLLVRLGRFGQHALVPAREAVGGVGHVWIPYPRDSIRRSPKVDPGTPLNRERELELLAQFGITGDAGRVAEIGKRAADAITARPDG
jgi:hypothetical protein